MPFPTATLRKAIVVLIVLLPALNAAGCSWLDHKYSRAAELTHPGGAESRVVERFGSASVREMPGHAYLRYATPRQERRAPCAVRLWYENRLWLITDDAWSVELDGDAKVLRTYH